MKKNLPVVGRFGYEVPKNRVLRALRPIIFEIISCVGRFFSPKKRKPKNLLLQIGCGSNIVNGFENVDFYDLKFWKKNYVGHDLRYRLPYNDAVFEGVFSEHTLEHLIPHDALFLLSELHRVMVPGSVIRIVVPSLDLYIENYNFIMDKTKINNEFKTFNSGCECIWNLTQNWGHVSCWNYEILRTSLLNVGFKNVKKSLFQDGDDQKLLIDLEHRKWESLYVEATA